MEYQNTQETAQAWNVSLRYVQRLLHDQRIPGARKFGGTWLIPAATAKPDDLRRERKKQRSSIEMELFTPYPKGNPNAALSLTDARYHAVAAADLAFRRGDALPAKQVWQQTPLQDVTKPTCASLAFAAAITTGDTPLYNEIAAYLHEKRAAVSNPSEKALLSLPEALAAVSMAAPEVTPQWLKQADFSMFPPKYAPYLLYLYTLHLRNLGDWNAVQSTARAALRLCAKANTFTWIDIYFGVIAAAASCELGRLEEAESFLLEALKLAIPYRYIAPFADYLGQLGGLLEGCLPDAQLRKQIRTLWEGVFKNWMRLHNEYTKQNITTVLTAQEYHVAHLRANGVTCAEVAQRMSLSVRRVKNIVATIYSKLYINKRSELKRFIV